MFRLSTNSITAFILLGRGGDRGRGGGRGGDRGGRGGRGSFSGSNKIDLGAGGTGENKKVSFD
jgi:hypothetical protein